MAQNEGLKNLLTQKDLIICEIEKDKNFMEIQMDEYETQIDTLATKYENACQDKDEKFQETKLLLKRIKDVENMLS
jgi:hypothetical protein